MQTSLTDDGSARVSGDIAYLPPFPSASSSRPSKADTAQSGGNVPSGPIVETRTVSEGRTNRLYLSSLPPQMAKALAVYDTDFDGILCEKDVAAASADLQHMQSLADNEKEGKIPLDFFPDEVRKLLNEFDDNGDGDLDVIEIMKGFNALQEERARRKQLVRVIMGLLMFTTALLVAFSLLFGFVLDENNDTNVGSSVLRVKGGDDIVQLASAQFAVDQNGVLVDRKSPQADCSTGQCTNPLQLSQSLQPGMLNSVLPDEDFAELRHMKISSEGSWIHFKVLATARYPALGSSEFGSVVVIYTHLGEITLDGEQLSFHESLDGAFSRAGFDVDPTGRRLLSTASLTGAFNFLARPITPELVEELKQSVQFVNGLRIFSSEFRRVLLCNGPRDEASGCYLQGRGVDVDHVEMWGSSKALTEVTNQTLYTINGEPWTRTRTTKRQFPLQTRYEIRNATHSLQYQEFTNINVETFPFWCSLAPSDSLYQDLMGSAPTDNADTAYTRAAGLEPFAVEALGAVELEEDGAAVPCHHWRIVSGGVEVLYFERDDERRLMQLQHLGVLYRFTGVSRAVSSVSDGALPAELDMDAIWARCDPPHVARPQRWADNQLSNAFNPQTGWGLPLVAEEEWGYSLQEYASEAELAAWMEGLGGFAGPDAEWCPQVSAAKDLPAAGAAYELTRYRKCDGSPAGAAPTLVRMSLREGEDACLRGSGSVAVLKECGGPFGRCRLHAAGALALSVDVWPCLRGRVPDYLLAAANASSEGAAATVTVTTSASAMGLTEACSLPAVDEDYQVGALPPLLMHRGEASAPVAAGQGAVALSAELRVHVLLGALLECGAGQPEGSPPKAALRIGVELAGELQVRACRDQRQGGFEACSAEEARKTHRFAVKRSVVPSDGGATCGEDGEGVYRYQCADAAMDCADPIAMVDMDTDTQNRPLACFTD